VEGKEVMKIVAIIQARIGSTRLPAKVLKDLCGKPVLWHVVSRVKSSTAISDVMVATTVNPIDDAIAQFCQQNGVMCSRGSESDVLDRYFQAARAVRADHIVRITSDCPLIDPRVIDQTIHLHLRTQADYTSNTMIETYPDGEDVEVFTFASLQKAHTEAALLSEREHVTPYIKNHRTLFKLQDLAHIPDLSAKRWTLDDPEDYTFVKAVYDALYMNDPMFSMDDVLLYIAHHPEIERLNAHIQRNLGYKKSLEFDTKIIK
jgi:spore coat polysaccharide biosynthesis protein SpsF (cytidylyltransferase family)